MGVWVLRVACWEPGAEALGSLTLPLKTRQRGHRHFSDIKVSLSFVSHQGLDPFQDLFYGTRGHDNADLVVEEDVLLAGSVPWPNYSSHRM